MGDGIIGRHTELEAVAGFLAEAAPGPAALLLAGEPGLGKTTVWQVAVDRARAAGFMVLSARPVEADASVAFGALADLFERMIDQALPTLPSPQRHALAVAVRLEDPGPSPIDQRAVSAATSAVLRSLCASGPVVVAIDDAQWLDRPSAQALEVALRRLSDTPVRLIAAERVDPSARPPVSFETTLPPHRTTRIDLAPMSVAALHDLLRDRVGRAFTRRMLLRIAEATGGNPLFALEIARSLPEDAAASVAALPMPKQLLELIETRVRALPVRTRSLLLTVASLRAPTLEAVRAATGHDEDEWRQALEDAETHGILEVERSRLRFSHPLFGAAVYASASPADRRRVHRTLATMIPDAEEQARHRALGAEFPDADLAAALDLAAEHARARGAPESGAELAEWARDLTPENRTADQQRRTVRVAEYRFHAGEVSAARRLLEGVLGQAPKGAINADVLRLLGEIRDHQDSFPDAIRLFEEALLHVGDEPSIAAGVELRLALCLRVLGRFEDAEVPTRRALELTERIGDPALEAEALAVMARLDVLLGRGLDEMKLRRALELEDPHRQVAMQFRPSKIAGDLYLYVGQLDRSVRILERERERVLERGEESDLPFVLSHLTWAECWRGRLSVAAAHAAESLDIARKLGGPSVQSMALAFAAVVAAHQGEADDAERWADEGLALGAESGWHTAIVWSSWALGALAVSRDDPHAAHAALGELTKEVEVAGLTDPVRAVFLAEEIEALVGLGRLDEAARLVDLLEGAGERLARGCALVQAGRCRALLLAAGGDIVGAAGAADGALEIGESVEHRLEVARTMLVAGQLQRRLRRKAAARNLVGHAAEIFEECGARIWARRAREELEHAGARRAGMDLTSSERRVASLVATGLTNREVAARLFMSPKTVEAHLASTYRKLGIRSRAQLGAQIRVRQSDEN